MFNISSISAEKQQDGVWTPYAGGEFLIASINSHAFMRYYNSLQRPHQKQIEKGTLDPAVSQEILCRALSKYILLDWKNVGDKGAPLAYSVETAFNALMANPELRSFVQEFSIDVSNFRAEEEAEEAKS